MWVEFVVGSRPCSEVFSPGSPVFLPPTFLNSNSIGNSRATGLSVEVCCVSPSLNKVNLFKVKRAFEKYEPRGFFSEFYGISTINPSS